MLLRQNFHYPQVHEKGESRTARNSALINFSFKLLGEHACFEIPPPLSFNQRNSFGRPLPQLAI